MTYDLHITRRADWSDPDGPEITHADWLAYQSIDPTLEKDIEYESSFDPAVASGAKESTHVVWTEWSGRNDGKEARLWLSHGNVMASDADAEFRQKMFLIADNLGAQLQGDRGEVYDSMGDPVKKGRKKKAKPETDTKRPWWRFW